MFHKLVLSLLIVAAAFCRQSGGKTPPDAGSQAVAILRNGNVLAGKIDRKDNRYVIVMPSGQISVPASQVELVCRDVEAGYRLKCAALGNDATADRHLRLARWCMRHDLWEYASDQLASARRLEPEHPRLTVLEQHLATARKSQQTSLTTQNSSLKRRYRRTPNREQLDDMVRTLPPGTLESFTTSVQPMLLNHCATAGCHGAQGTTAFHLERLPSMRQAMKRPTHRNLHAVLKLVRNGDPARSPLLTYPIRAHGGADKPIFTANNSQQYQQLVDWVRKFAHPNAPDVSVPNMLVARKPETLPLAAQPAPLPDSKPIHSATSANSPSEQLLVIPGLQQPSSVLPVNYEQPVEKPVAMDQKLPETGEPPPAATAESAKDRSDPFDAATFNNKL